jgi:hypothetical protein
VYPEKRAATNHAKNLPTVNGTHKHHWSYLTEHHRDVFYLTVEDHRTVHSAMTYDQERMQYRMLSGELIDSAEKAMDYYAKYIGDDAARKSREDAQE